jgi:hypothetical protein
VKERKLAEWNRWTKSERNWAVVAAMVSRAFDFKALGLADPLRPFWKGKSTQPEVFYLGYIQPHLATFRRLAQKNPAILIPMRFRNSKNGDETWEGGNAYLRHVLTACDEIVTLKS